MTTPSRRRTLLALSLTSLFLVMGFGGGGVGLAPAFSAEPLTDADKAAMVLSTGQRAWHEKNYPVAIERFREFIKLYGGHKDVNLARYGLGIALIEGPQKDFVAAVEALQPPAGQADFRERPFALYYLGLAHRGLGQLELDQIIPKPQEAVQRLAAA